MIKALLTSGFLLLVCAVHAQTDSLIFKTGDVAVGEIKSMDRGVLVIETDYSKDDFRVKWVEIKEIYTKSLLLASTTDGRRYYGHISTSEDGLLQVITVDGDTAKLDFDTIVYLKSVDQGFLDRLNAGIDLGFSFTKARNQRQFTLRSQVGYIAERWNLSASYNTLNSSQDSVADIHRTDGQVTFKYVLPKEWYIIGQLDFLSNTEQLLDLRTNTKVGIGRYLARTNQMYWGVQGGISFNFENYEGSESDRNSREAWIGTELNLYDIGDFSLLTNGVVYPSLSEQGRVRIDFSTDLKYDLPLDFYIKSGITLNYDNQPVEGGTDLDYVWQTSFGWEW